jgi:hypothetical protein
LFQKNGITMICARVMFGGVSGLDINHACLRFVCVKQI